MSIYVELRPVFKVTMTKPINHSLSQALWKIYHRPGRPTPWLDSGNLPWNEPAFSERMLREHLEDNHGAASRVSAERALIIDWLWSTLGLQPGHHLFDVTCGPGLYAVEFARRGCQVTGLDFSPASIAYAKDLALSQGLAARCHFIEQDLRQMPDYQAVFDAAILLYGQLAVFPQEEARMILARLARSLKPGGRLILELLDQTEADKTNSNWWFTDDKGLWGDKPFLHLGERFWNETTGISVERFYIIHLETGQMTEISLCDQTYRVETMTAMLRQAGFNQVEVHRAWAGLPLYDAVEWNIYVAAV